MANFQHRAGYKSYHILHSNRLHRELVHLHADLLFPLCADDAHEPITASTLRGSHPGETIK
eukprot:CAMPEP_0206141454 /NCGR_PEP_ID=MMETSP1473-20131121/12967_1 /ASSEMBLY_ACC=CAM_ASM_001109 /TAXON_ID=1461547 /ORGANISM="Stichococcus sp, Strain RCC1054" /LENGTH=60 /DNA_ID=CAMNT_0053536033 /DNA_START=175 /DNA_END=357 /DNA_ORIENTATION=-